MPKETIEKTKLEDDALLYQKREEKKDREKFKELDGKGKLQFFRDYYLVKVLIVVIAAALLGSVIYTMVKPKPEAALNVAVVNDQWEEQARDDFKTDLLDYLGLDAGKNTIEVMDALWINEDGSDMATRTKLMVNISAGMVDVMIADREQFLSYAEQGLFVDLSDKLPAQLDQKLDGQILKSGVIEEEGQEPTGEYSVGISLENSGIYGSLTNQAEPMYIGITTSTKNMEDAVKMIQYLFQ